MACSRAELSLTAGDSLVDSGTLRQPVVSTDEHSEETELNGPCIASDNVLSSLSNETANEPSHSYPLPRMPLRSFKLCNNPPAIIFDFDNHVNADQVRNMFEVVDQQNIVELEDLRRGQGRIRVEFGSLEHAQAALNHRLERIVRDDSRDKVVQDRLDLISERVDSKLAEMDGTFQSLKKNSELISKSVDENLTIYVEQITTKPVPPPVVTIPDDDEIERIKLAAVKETQLRLKAEHDADLDFLRKQRKADTARMQKEKAEAKKLQRKAEQESAKYKTEIEKLKVQHTKEKAALITNYERKRRRSPSPSPEIRVRAPSVFATSAAHLASPSRPKSLRLSTGFHSRHTEPPPSTPNQKGAKHCPAPLKSPFTPSTPTKPLKFGSNSIDRLATAKDPPMTPITPDNFKTFVGSCSAFPGPASAVYGMPLTPSTPRPYTPAKSVEFIVIDSDSEDECIKDEGEDDIWRAFKMRSGRPARKSAVKADAHLKSIIKSCGEYKNK